MFDAEKFGEAMGAAIREAVAPLQAQILYLTSEVAKKANAADIPAPVVPQLPDFAAIIADQVKAAVSAIELPKPADPIGVAGAMIDRDGALQITLSNGEVKNLGRVEGKDGVDGLSLAEFDMQYIEETHEVELRAVCGTRTKSVRFPAGGIRPAGYWREGTKAQANEAWVHDGSMYIAKRATSAKPESKSDDWLIAARRGRDGETVIRQAQTPAQPIKLGVAQ